MKFKRSNMTYTFEMEGELAYLAVQVRLLPGNGLPAGKAIVILLASRHECTCPCPFPSMASFQSLQVHARDLDLGLACHGRCTEFQSRNHNLCFNGVDKRSHHKVYRD